MKKTINFSQFCDGFPESYKDNFSYEGKKALYDYFDSYEEETGETIEYDPVAFCCEFTEYEDLKELQKDYADIKDIEDLRDNTQVIMIDDYKGDETGGIIIQSF